MVWFRVLTLAVLLTFICYTDLVHAEDDDNGELIAKCYM